MSSRASEIVKRVSQSLLTLVGVGTITFALVRLTPGSPANQIRAQLRRNNPNLSPEQINQRVQRYVSFTPDEPLHVQYIEYILQLSQGELGRSIRYQDPVLEILAEALPWTIFVLSIATFLTFGLGILLGAIMAYWEGSRFDTFATGYTTFISSIPYYLLALILVYVLGFIYPVFPTGGRYPSGVDIGWNLDFIIGVFYHAALPVLSFTLGGMGSWALTMRGNSISVLGSDFMRVAELRGLRSRRIAVRYVTHNAILPMYTALLISLGFLMGGAVILEEIFAYQGVGFYMLRAIETRDYPLMMGGFLMITASVIVTITFADFTYSWLDPRTESRGNESYGGSAQTWIRRIIAGIRNVGRSDETTETVDVRQSSSGDETTDFRAVSDVEMTTQEKIYEFVDIWILTPYRITMSDWRARVGFGLLAIYLAVGFVGPFLISPPEPNQAQRYLSVFENMKYPLGSDIAGRGILRQLVHGTPPMLKMIFAGSVFATVLGTVIGTVSGYSGGFVDRALTFLTDMAMTIPGIPLIIVLAATLQPENPYLVGVILTVNAWAGLARSLRSEVLKLRDVSYVEASRIMGVQMPSIIGRDIVPNIMPYVLINFVQIAREVVFSSVGLYFLGVLPFSEPNWGVMLNYAYTTGGALYTLETAHWLFAPMVVIIGMSFSFILISQGMDQLFNPRLRARHAKTVESDETDPAAPADD